MLGKAGKLFATVNAGTAKNAKNQQLMQQKLLER
ncbi:hypothetical protein BHO_0900068 (plasmid) [Borrelia hermsii YBT]|uniref:Uncharacterized protein n=1 Tax=Borrelia hermsii YBT TaxID=1313295 RepID=W5T7L6_BORHE|nr:hypothetical protein BHO_0900068 [Borrelia hermsii YBT]